MYQSLFDIITGRYGMEAVSGPVGVATVVGDAVRLGILNLLYLDLLKNLLAAALRQTIRLFPTPHKNKVRPEENKEKRLNDHKQHRQNMKNIKANTLAGKSNDEKKEETKGEEQDSSQKQSDEDKPKEVLFFRHHIFSILAPFVYKRLHIVRQLRVQTDHLLGARMDKAQSLGVQSLTRTEFETITHKLAVLAKVCTLQYFVAAIHIVVEQDVPYMLHMHPYLMCTPRLQVTLHKSDITEPFKHPVMSYSMLTDIGIG